MSYRDLYSPRKSDFIDEVEIDQIISEMEEDDKLNTNPVYVKESESLCLVTFREKTRRGGRSRRPPLGLGVTG
jgi:hypothetical protein